MDQDYFAGYSDAVEEVKEAARKASRKPASPRLIGGLSALPGVAGLAGSITGAAKAPAGYRNRAFWSTLGGQAGGNVTGLALSSLPGIRRLGPAGAIGLTLAGGGVGGGLAYWLAHKTFPSQRKARAKAGKKRR